MAASPYARLATFSGGSTGGSGGASAYGSRPNPTAVPNSVYQETQAADPALVALGDKSTGVINSQLSGQLSPETINSLRDNAAQFGVASGMPGSGLQINGGLRNLGLNVEQMQNQGLGNYLNALKSVGSMQLDPGLVSSIGTYNNQIAAAPDPAAAAAEEERLWQQHYKQTMSPAGGTGSFSGTRPVSASGGGGFGIGGSGSGNSYQKPAANWWDSSPGMQVYGPTGGVPTDTLGFGNSSSGASVWDSGSQTPYSYIGAAGGERGYSPGYYAGDPYGNGSGDPSLAYDPYSDTYGGVPVSADSGY